MPRRLADGFELSRRLPHARAPAKQAFEEMRRCGATGSDVPMHGCLLLDVVRIPVAPSLSIRQRRWYPGRARRMPLAARCCEMWMHEQGNFVDGGVLVSDGDDGRITFLQVKVARREQ